MEYMDILSSVYETGIVGIIGGEDNSLSKPMLYKKDGKLYAVFMVYETLYEGYPHGFVFVDLGTLEARVMTNEETIGFTSMPDSVFTEAKNEGEPADYSPVDFEELFMSCIKDGKEDREAYSDYMGKVISHAQPLARSFYSYFR